MKRRIILLLLLLSLFQCERPVNEKVSPKAIKGVLDLRTVGQYGEPWDFKRDGTVDLIGEWEFYWNELIENPEEQKNFFKNYDSTKIQYIPIPSEWQNLEVNGNKLPSMGYAMYRLRVLMPKSEALYSFSMADVCTSHSIYINGVLHHSNGKVGKSEVDAIPFQRHGNFPLKRNAEELEIVFLISNFYHVRAGFWNKVSLGHRSLIEATHKNKITMAFLTFGVLFIMSIYHLVLYFLRTKDRSPFYFGAICFLLAVRTIAMEERVILDIFPFLPFKFVYQFEHFLVYPTLAFFFLFIHELFPIEGNVFVLKFTVIFSTIVSLLPVITIPYYYDSFLFKSLEIYLVFCILYTGYILFLAIRNKRTGSLTFLFGVIILFISIINDILYGNGLIYNTVNLTVYGFLSFVLAQSIVLAIRFSNAFIMSENLAEELKDKTESLFTSNIELNNLKDGLEIKVEERTKKLEEAYHKNLQEEQKVAKLKAEMFTIQERENLFFDIHNHIKGDVSELGLLLEKIKNYQVPADVSNQATLLLRRVASSVKNRMLILEDKQLLEKDFLNGLQMSLLRRYTALNRRFILEMGEFVESKLSSTSIEFKNNFYSIVTEISNNDLKYGFGESFWKLELFDSDKILLEMKSNSNFQGISDTGKGHTGIIRKVESLGGSLDEEIKDGFYKIKILMNYVIP